MSTLPPVDLATLALELLEKARATPSGRSAAAVVSEPAVRAVLMALTGGTQLADHESPPGATLQVLAGAALVSAASGDSVEVGTGQLIRVPAERHGVEALEDTVILLTVAPFGPGQEDPSTAGPTI